LPSSNRLSLVANWRGCPNIQPCQVWLTLSGYWLRNLLGGAERFRVDGVTGCLAAQVAWCNGAAYLRPCNVCPDAIKHASVKNIAQR
jgi:hypothetical protein